MQVPSYASVVQRSSTSAVQAEDEGSTPIRLLHTPAVRTLSPAEANGMLERWHYLGAVRGQVLALGHDEGCCVFTNLRSRLLEKRLLPYRAIELARMVGMPNHRWAMTSLMAVVARIVRRRGYDIIVTYSDPMAGHTGKVYKAAGYRDDGLIEKDGHPAIYIDEKLVAPRTLYDRHGTQSIPALQTIYGTRLTLAKKELKRRWILELTKRHAE